MRTRRMFGTIALLALLGFALAGCGEDADSPTGQTSQGVDDYEALDFDQEFGGLTGTDEEIAFDDEYLKAVLQEEDLDDAGDELALDPEVAALEAAAEADTTAPSRMPSLYALRIVWGVLDGPVDTLGVAPESYDLLDWSGTLRVDRGIVVLRRLIRFERPYDHRDPRPDSSRAAVAWTSHTGPHFDGILVQIIEPPLAEGETEVAPNRLHFETGPYSGSFAVADLAGLDLTSELATPGNSIHFLGYLALGPDQCPRGFLDGLWLPAGDGVGFFKGRLVGPLGCFHGLIRGGYGYDAAGQRVIVGKVIGRHGECRGLLRGTWEPDEAEPGCGTFSGEWGSRRQYLGGVLGGHYRSRPDAPGGYFVGRWTLRCSWAAEEIVH